MRLIGLAVALTVGVILAPLAAEAQEAGKVYRVGILWLGPDPAPSNPFFDVFRQSLGDSGYFEGTNLSFSHRWGRPERLRDLATELVRLKVDVLFAGHSPAIRRASAATTTIPLAGLPVGHPAEPSQV